MCVSLLLIVPADGPPDEEARATTAVGRQKVKSRTFNSLGIFIQ